MGIECNISQCYYNKDGRCLKDGRMFYCPKGRDDVKVKYDNDVNVSHNGSTVTLSHISMEFKGRYGAMLADLKESNKMYYTIIEDVLKAGIDRLWFDLNARRNEI